MVEQREGESRLRYLVRVLDEFVTSNALGCEFVDYDGTTCDGECLVQDFVHAVEEITE